jgi:hypothetical protein
MLVNFAPLNGIETASTITVQPNGEVNGPGMVWAKTESVGVETTWNKVTGL